MLDAKSLLNSFLSAGAAPSAGRRIESAVGPEGLGGRGGLFEQLSGMLGGSAGGGGLSGLLAGLSRGAGDMAGRTGDAVRRNDPLAVGGLGAVAGAVLGGRGGAVGGGALALLGSLAFSALQRAQAQQSGAAPAPQDPSALPVELRGPSEPGDEAILDSRALILLRAMINAAKADGHIDPAEMDKILGRLDKAGADTTERDFVLQEMRTPADLEALLAQVQGPELAAEVYAASLLAIEVDTAAERDYLRRLAAGLRLPAEAVAHLHQALGVPAA